MNSTTGPTKTPYTTGPPVYVVNVFWINFLVKMQRITHITIDVQPPRSSSKKKLPHGRGKS
jgi:hypothetical protein